MSGEEFLQASVEGDQATAARLLESGAVTINHASAGGGITALHWAIIKGHFQLVKFLLDRGADPKAVTKSGMTPLDEAVLRGRLNVIRLLDEKGVNVVDAFDKEGQAPIHVAAREGFFPIVKYLVEEKKCTVWLNNKQHVRALNISRAQLKAHPEHEEKHREVIHYLFDLEGSGMGGDPLPSNYLPEAIGYSTTKEESKAADTSRQAKPITK